MSGPRPKHRKASIAFTLIVLHLAVLLLALSFMPAGVVSAYAMEQNMKGAAEAGFSEEDNSEKPGERIPTGRGDPDNTDLSTSGPDDGGQEPGDGLCSDTNQYEEYQEEPEQEGEQQPRIQSIRSAPQEAATETEELHRYTVTAFGLPAAEVSAVEAEIVDIEGNVLRELRLNESSGWTASWETVDPEETYSARLKSVLGQNGENVSGDWLYSSETTVNVGQTGETELVWLEQEELEPGGYTYVFKLQSEPGTLLAASSKLSRGYGYKYYELIPEYSAPENASSAAQWSVSPGIGGWSIVSVSSLTSTAGYLSILDQGNRNVCAAFNSSDVFIGFVGGVFTQEVNGTANYLQFGNTGSTTTSLGAASVFTAYRKTFLTRYTTVHSTSLVFTEAEENRTTQAVINLSLEGNIADRTKSFPFTLLVDGSPWESFELGDGEEYSIAGIPCGARLTVREDAGDYTTTSTSGTISGNEVFIMEEVPRNEIRIQFINSLEGDIDTGVYDDLEPIIILLTVIPIPIIILFVRRIKKQTAGGNKV